MKKPDSGIQVGAFGSILTIDAPNFWVVTGFHASNLIVSSTVNPNKWRTIHPEDFWVLVDSL
jgi:hypothetical protein